VRVHGLLWLTAIVLVLAACGNPSTGAPAVTADPKTLVLQPGDYPADWDSGVNYPAPTGSALTGFGTPVKSKVKPLDAYQYFIPFQNLTSAVALFRSTDEAHAVFASIALPASGRELSFVTETRIDLTLGDEQRVFSWDPTANIHEVDIYWRSGNVIAELWTFALTTKYYPTTSALAADDGSILLLIEPLAPRMQTHIRLASQH
jgi:hypothetical protein